MKAFITLSLLIYHSMCLKRNDQQSYSMSTSYSSFSSFNNNDGKPERHIKSMETEEYREKTGEGPEQIRKYGEIYTKDNNEPAILKKKANTNVEEEGLVLGNNPEETKILKNGDEEKHFLNKFNSDDFFNIGKDDSFFKEFFDEFAKGNNSKLKKHGNYDKFLDEKKKNLISESHK